MYMSSGTSLLARCREAAVPRSWSATKARGVAPQETPQKRVSSPSVVRRDQMHSMASPTMASSSSGAKSSSFSFRPAAVVPQARAVASPGQKDAQLRRRSSSKSAVMMDSAVLSCPWPRTLEYSSAAPAQGQGIIAGLKQLWAKPGPLPQEVQSLAGGFTDAPNACNIEQDAPEGVVSWWRYQGFKL